MWFSVKVFCEVNKDDPWNYPFYDCLRQSLQWEKHVCDELSAWQEAALLGLEENGSAWMQQGGLPKKGMKDFAEDTAQLSASVSSWLASIPLFSNNNNNKITAIYFRRMWRSIQEMRS